MDMDQAAVFLAGTILMSLAVIVIAITAVVINHIIYRWWKPLGWNFGFLGNNHTRFATPEELEQMSPRIEPTINKNQSQTKVS